jgi:hypothetical protein
MSIFRIGIQTNYPNLWRIKAFFSRPELLPRAWNNGMSQIPSLAGVEYWNVGFNKEVPISKNQAKILRSGG